MYKALLGNPGSKLKIMSKVVLIAGIFSSFALAVLLSTDRFDVWDFWSFMDVILFGVLNFWKFMAIWIIGIVTNYVLALALSGIAENVEGIHELRSREAKDI